VIAATTVAVVLAPQVPAVFGAVLAQRQETTLQGTGYLARIDLWQLALGLWRDHPFLGIGAGNWSAAVSLTYSGGTHNSLLQILVELGIFGAAFATIAFFAILAATWRIRGDRLRLCLLTGILGSFINCLFEASFEGVAFTWFLGVFLGGVLATSMREQVREGTVMV